MNSRSQVKTSGVVGSEIAESHWTGLYKAGALAALIIASAYIVELIVVVTNGLPPDTVEDWFALFQSNRTLGLLKAFSLDIFAVTFFVPFFLALYTALRKVSQFRSYLVAALIFAFVGMAVYFATNTAFSMLYLSDQYAIAATDIERSQLLASGRTMLAVFNGTGPFIAFTFNSIAGLIVSIVMLRTRVFSKLTAWAGILGNVLELGLPPSIAPAFFLKIDPFLIGLGGAFLILWYVLSGLRLLRLRQRESDQLEKLTSET